MTAIGKGASTMSQNLFFQRLKNVQLSLVLVSQSLDLFRLRVYEWKDMSDGPFLSFHNCELDFASDAAKLTS